MATLKYKTPEGEWKKVSIGGGGSITLDSEMSDTSTNAVSNKVIKEYVDDEVEDAKMYSEEMANNAEKAAKKYTDEKIKNSGGGEGVAELMVEITYDELVSLRNSNQLTPGMKYRITDYETMTSQVDTQSAGHPFDVIVTALDGNILDEKASAIWSERDTDGYFANSNLPAWDVRYCLDNDATRFSWAASAGSFLSVDFSDLDLGVITASLYGSYQYDGKTYVGWNCIIDGLNCYILTANENPSIGEIPLVYIEDFGGAEQMGVIVGVQSSSKEGKGVIYRLIDENKNDAPYDFKNIQFVRKLTDGEYNENGEDAYVYTFDLYYEGDHFDCSSDSACNNNIIERGAGLPNNVFLNAPLVQGFISCYDNHIGLYSNSNTFGDNCISNKLGYYCSNNIFGSDCASNTLKDCCSRNKFGSQCVANSLGFNCYENEISKSVEQCVFGDNCNGNIIKFNCDNNIFGNECVGNVLGRNCHHNNFGGNTKNCELGGYCYYCKFYGNNQHIVIGSANDDFHCRKAEFKSGVSHITLSPNTMGTGEYLENYNFNRTPSSYSMKTIEVTRGRGYDTYITTNVSGEVIQYTIDDIINK